MYLCEVFKVIFIGSEMGWYTNSRGPLSSVSFTKPMELRIKTFSNLTLLSRGWGGGCSNDIRLYCDISHIYMEKKKHEKTKW